MKCPRPASLISTIESLCDLGRLQDALKLVFSNSFLLDYSLYSKPLQICINISAEKEGRLLHHRLVTNGFTSNLCLNTKLVIFYSKVGDMVTADNVFQQMSARNVVSWTSLISGYSQNGNPKEALRVFSTMHRVGVKANQFTYGSALRACTNMMCLDRGSQIQGCIQKGWFIKNLFVQSALIVLHSKCGRMEDACYLFASTFERDVVSWNSMISGYAVRGFGDDAFIMFRCMLRDGMLPDCFTFGSALRTSIGGSDIKKISQIHSFIIQLGFETYSSVTGSLVDAYAKCGHINRAKSVYRSTQNDIVSCTALIMGYAHEGNKIDEALELFNEVHHIQIGIDNILLCSMINICANTASLGLGRQIHAIFLKCGPSEDMAMGNSLIDMYSKSGDIEEAEHVFDSMCEKNVISWTSLIAGYGRHGYGDKALAFYKKMENEGLEPNDVTFLSLLFACSHNGLIDEGFACFNNMVSKYNIVPRLEHYTCMVDLFSRGGQLKEAYDLIFRMNIKPNASLWGAFLGGCNIYGNMLLGEVAARNIFNIEPDKSVNYVILAGIYSGIGLWRSACKMRKLLEARRLKKAPGSSFLLSMNKRVFLVPS